MSFDDWKCSPPCPTCGTPNCLCTEPDEEPENIAIPTLEEAEVILREHGLDPDEVGKTFAAKVKELLETMK